MAQQKTTWLRDLLIVPLVVGLVVAVVAYVLPKLFAESKQISYSIEEPIAYLDKSSIGSAVVTVNNLTVPEVYAVRVHLWNSGDLALKDIAVRFEFSPLDNNFRILSVSHNTNPAKEFGNITEQDDGNYSKRFIYQLLNSQDEDTIIFLTTAKVNLNVYSKAEGLSVKAVSVNKDREFKWYHGAIVGMLASALSSFIEMLFNLRKRRVKKQVEHESVE